MVFIVCTRLLCRRDRDPLSHMRGAYIARVKPDICARNRNRSHAHYWQRARFERGSISARMNFVVPGGAPDAATLVVTEVRFCVYWQLLGWFR